MNNYLQLKLPSLEEVDQFEFQLIHFFFKYVRYHLILYIKFKFENFFKISNFNKKNRHSTKVRILKNNHTYILCFFIYIIIQFTLLLNLKYKLPNIKGVVKILIKAAPKIKKNSLIISSMIHARQGRFQLLITPITQDWCNMERPNKKYFDF